MHSRALTYQHLSSIYKIIAYSARTQLQRCVIALLSILCSELSRLQDLVIHIDQFREFTLDSRKLIGATKRLLKICSMQEAAKAESMRLSSF